MRLRFHSSCEEIPRSATERLHPYVETPLVTREWLVHLEASGSIRPETGWYPRHATVVDGKGDGSEDDMVHAVVPLYLHSESWGEFVFDFALAEAAEELGVPYYPKLVGMSPATPITAYSFLEPPETKTNRARRDLYVPVLRTLQRYCRDEGIPVLQFNFVAPDLVPLFREAGMTAWAHQGFEWHNEGYETFQDYLSRFNKNQRRNIRRERRRVRESGLSLAVVPGNEAPGEYFSVMAELYERTNDRFGPWAARFLTPEFFTGIPDRLKSAVLFAAAHADPERTDSPLALAMLLRGKDCILGRYWGARREIRDLHFELCYYTPIEWAVEHGISRFDPGMGGSHKARRGFSSTRTYSLHWFADSRMQRLFAANIDRINAIESRQIERLNAAIPWKRS